jgi:hypothetical protein
MWVSILRANRDGTWSDAVSGRGSTPVSRSNCAGQLFGRVWLPANPPLPVKRNSRLNAAAGR